MPGLALTPLCRTALSPDQSKVNLITKVPFMARITVVLRYADFDGILWELNI